MSNTESARPGRVQDKVCLITGGAEGLGRADALALAREGARVIITDLNEVAGQATAAEIGPRGVFVHHDVRDEAGWRTLITDVMARFGRLDVLVNNAGVLRFGDIETVTLEDWRFVNGVNVEGTFLGCKHAIPAMRDSGGGSIINVSSTVAIQGYARSPAYTATKGAVQALTRSIAVHCMQRGYRIRCNAIHPHNAESPMVHRSHAAIFGALPEAQRPPLAAVPADGVANTVLFLSSDESSDFNGALLNLDRGTACIVGAIRIK
jgi:3(or 17)beta-hydroxysteroid dehydrogenase